MKRRNRYNNIMEESTLKKNIRIGYEMGFGFTPLNQKVPILTGWQKAPKANLSEAMDYAAIGNVGVRCGAVSAPKGKYLLIVDVDEGGVIELPETMTVTTHNGSHHYFYTNVKLGNSSGKLSAHVDTRGEGGQCVFPGSKHPDGGEYVWASNGTPIADLPQELLDILKPPKPKLPPCPTNTQPYLRNIISCECRNVRQAVHGERNHVLNTSSHTLGTLIGSHGLDPSAASYELLMAAMDAGLGEAEARKTIRSGMTAGEGKPRALPTAPVVAGEPAKYNECIMVNFADVVSKPIKWLWDQRFALGKLSLIAGDPGLGKSFVSISMASTVSTGSGWPCERGNTSDIGSVIMLSAEDDPEDTIKPRLEAMGADFSKVNHISMIKTVEGQETFVNLVTDLMAIERAVQKLDDCKLIIIDPITAYLGKTDGHSNSDIRAVLKPLADMASRFEVALVGVTHLNKGGGTNPLYRAMGSLAFVAAARTVWMVTADTEDRSRRLMLPAKNNIAQDTNGLAYRILDGAVAWENVPVDTTAQDHFEAVESTFNPKPREDAKEWILEILHDGAVWSVEMDNMAKEEGHSTATIRRARKELKEQNRISMFRDGRGEGSQCKWSLTYAPPVPRNEANDA